MPGEHQPSAQVLVIEDDTDTRLMLNDLLHSAGYAPVLVPTGEDGIDLLKNEPVDIVVLDIRLPGMDGYDVCEQIRTTSGYDVPILMLTANQDQGGAAKGFRRGADDYVRKPFDPDELIGRIESLRRQQQRANALITDNEAMRQTLEQLQQKLAQEASLSSTETAMRREYVHTVATHLRALCGVIETEFRRNINPEVREAVQCILSRTRGVALVYETSDLLQDQPADFDAIVRTIGLASKQIYNPRSRIPVKIDGMPLPMPLELAAHLQGSVTWSSTPDAGTVVTVRCPISAAAAV
jgi:DNA-binding response OmpR family regulator